MSYKFPRNTVPSTRDIHELIKKVRSTGSLLDNPARKCCVLIEEKVHETGARLEHTPQKSLRHLAQEISISKLLSPHLMHEVNLSLFKWYRV
jgi:hypothetical protein